MLLGLNLSKIFLEPPAGEGKERVFKERINAFNGRQRRGAMRRKIHEVCVTFGYYTMLKQWVTVKETICCLA